MPRYLASQPGRLRVPYWRYLCHYPGETIGSTLPFAACGVFVASRLMSVPIPRAWMQINLPACFLFAFVSGVYFGRFRRRIRFHFYNGDLCPGVVVSANPTWVAVYTDMRRGNKPYPAIKIVPAPLGRCGNPKPVVGMRIVMISVYRGMTHPQMWSDFEPLPIGVATASPEVHARYEAQRGEIEWKKLDMFLKECRKPLRPGLQTFGRPPGAMGRR